MDLLSWLNTVSWISHWLLQSINKLDAFVFVGVMYSLFYLVLLFSHIYIIHIPFPDEKFKLLIVRSSHEFLGLNNVWCYEWEITISVFYCLHFSFLFNWFYFNSFNQVYIWLNETYIDDFWNRMSWCSHALEFSV